VTATKSAWVPRNVYVIAEQDGPLKIGVSDNPTGRMATLKAKRRTLSVVASFSRDGDARLIESIAHRLLLAKHVKGEWFDVSDAQAIAAIESAIAMVESGDLAILNPGIPTTPSPRADQTLFRPLFLFSL
jgi:hypothetical protein